MPTLQPPSSSSPGRPPGPRAGQHVGPAVALWREHGIAVIPGGCPNMVGATSDPGHRYTCALLKRRDAASCRGAPPDPTLWSSDRRPDGRDLTLND